ncbi:hypothetical protein [Vibrio gazogenes]|uniref:Uncharacterized protein n=1 Tax=Vibrio gazogenes DSM 21264 = NBRC 103151 TaxID=1123492 RepID=A0A1M5HL23_VIBGA|nr:hypothetical protein [Vibrio gazogenes]USP14503.1 hypothetical protein MKS89_04055 [Vibrio gazogenes]SHG16653.1 hypothetical protein SAMN02745781_04129 [Vibrio gazogenes DSM 21264] [Vibrio gazogenes DSM 21264 = NBRC 103151]SJN57662.1 hypothetical protein BQ6471_02651 [Vibrio gazogenes]
MDVSSIEMAKACTQFSRLISRIYDDAIHISYSVISLDTREIYTLSTDYDWHLSYWEQGLNGTVGQRMSPGLASWRDKDAEYHQLLDKYRIPDKVDYTWLCPQRAEIVSLACRHQLTSQESHQLAVLRPSLAYHAHKLWLKHQVATLPYQSVVVSSDTPDAHMYDQNHFRFGDIVLTAKEMSTIRLLLSFNSPKEIAWKHHCSESAERKRIDTIKRKIHCTGNRSTFFQLLHKHGILDACLDVYTTSL